MGNSQSFSLYKVCSLFRNTVSKGPRNKDTTYRVLERWCLVQIHANSHSTETHKFCLVLAGFREGQLKQKLFLPLCQGNRLASFLGLLLNNGRVLCACYTLRNLLPFYTLAKGLCNKDTILRFLSRFPLSGQKCGNIRRI